MGGFLAWRGQAEARAALQAHQVTQFTARTVTDVEALLAEFAAARRRGFAVSLRQYKGVQSAVAAPVFEASGRVWRVLCTVAFSSDLDAHNVDAVGSAVRVAADRITRRTGGTPRGEEAG
jgi:IclR family acetate operon transcriptional repressor